jgi:hypothetical protein
MPTPWSNPTKHALDHKPHDAAHEAEDGEKHKRQDRQKSRLPVKQAKDNARREKERPEAPEQESSDPRLG